MEVFAECNRWEPTYYGANIKSRIDYIAAPMQFEAAHQGTWVMRRAARSLQLIPADGFHDHLPINVVWRLRDRRQLRKAAPKRRCLDEDRVAAAVQYDKGRMDFYEALEAKLREKHDEIERIRETPKVQDHWDLLNECIGSAAYSIFGKERGGRPSAEQLNFDERRELMPLRARHRQRRPEAYIQKHKHGGEDYWLAVDWHMWDITRRLRWAARVRALERRRMLEGELHKAWRGRHSTSATSSRTS